MSRGTRGFEPLRDLPVPLWLTALVVVTLIHPWVPAPRWLMLHLLLLGALTHAILVWSQHFADALLHTAPRPVDARNRTARLLLHNAGALAVIAGVLADLLPLTVAGAASVAVAVGWHGLALMHQQDRALPSRFAATVHHYVAAACLLPVGAALGTVLAAGLPTGLHERILLAHVTVNLLGWVGITVVGTLLTLWPTMLRTRIPEGAERAGVRGLPALLGATAVTAVGAVAGSAVVTAAGLATYLGGLALTAAPLVRAARSKPPTAYAPWSVFAAVTWWAALLVAGVLALLTAPDWESATESIREGIPLLAAGFAAQLLLGALSYLVPVALGGGPAAVRAASNELDRGSALRVVTTNAGLLLLAFPSPGLVRVLASVAVLVALAAFLPLLFRALRASRIVKQQPVEDRTPRSRPEGRPAGQLRGLAATGVAVVALVAAVGVAIDPVALGGPGSAAAAGVTATGDTTTVRVEMRDMRFHPGTVEVPAGDRLVLEVVNADQDVHDLVLDSGDRTERLPGGESETLDLGVVGRDLEGWCSVVGHRQRGMVMTVDVIGGSSESHAGHEHGPGHDMAGTHDDGPPASYDPMAEPGHGFEARDATLPPRTGKVHRRTLTVTETEREVALGVTQTMWTYDGTAPGPVLHGKVGDVFEITLVNEGSIGHSVDFHAGALAPDRPMRTIEPGESLVYRFTATRAGIWMYHCSTMPMAAHIANGLYGAVVIEPSDLPEVDRSYVLVQGELYLGEESVDVDALNAEEPDAVVFNGYADQYAHDPLPATVGERVRVWVLDAGPNRPSSFHVVGGQFDTVWSEGAYLLDPRRDGPEGGAQVLPLLPAQGGFVELMFPEPGEYPFLSHVMVDAERGARGVFQVSAAE
ncbi:MAG TPA: multicopper oxidase domain-containing protein [Marmoricola sp.]|nr:multicopper oxidase domain-containing protein [Marmoricola sp.]